MRPHRLLLSGWGPYKEKVDIDFTNFDRRGLFLITGATGAGKTTVFDAVTYALYGELSGETREKNSVRSDFAKEDTLTYAELYFSHGGKEYYVKRNPEYLRPKKRKTGADAFTKEKENAILKMPDGSILEGTREVNAKMKEILTLDYAQFKQVTMIAQGEFTRLLLAKPQEKTKIFRDLFGTGIYDKFSQELRSRAGRLYANVMEQKHRIEEDLKLASLTVSDNPDFSNYIKELEDEEKILKKEIKGQEARLDKLETEEKQASVLLTQAEENNSRFAKRQLLLQEKEDLKKKEGEVQLWEERLIGARKAAALEKDHILLKQAEKNVAALEMQCQEEARILSDWEAEQKEKESVFLNRTFLVQYLELRLSLEESLSKAEDLKKQKQSLEQELVQSREVFLKLQEKKEEAEEQYREADKAYKQSVIGIVARMLKEDQPCPVCGSLVHPKRAALAEHVLSEEELEKLRTVVQKLQEEYQNQFVITGQKQAETEKQKQVYEGLLKQNEEQKQQLEKYMKQLCCIADGSLEGFAFLNGQPVQRAKEQLEESVKRYETLAVRIEEKRNSVVRIRAEAEKEQTLFLQAVKKFETSMKNSGFVTMEVFEESRLTFEKQAELEQQIADYKRKIATNQELLKQIEEVLRGKKPQETGELEQQAEFLRKEKKAAAGLLQDKNIRLSEVKKVRQSIRQKLTVMEELKKEYGYVKDLENMACGNNARKLVFEQFVLAGYFEEILRMANLRFAKMTAGRYELSRVSEVGDGRSKDNLEVQVFDFYTGRHRSVKTLSGGELFKASLCLALGLSDVIQAMHGGIKVEALFLDEGFGALDNQSLDQACEVLHSLTENSRMIGIISHVPQLRERIENQLIVEKTSSGSKVKIMVT